MTVEYGILTNDDINDGLLKEILEDEKIKYCPENIKDYISIKGNIGFIAKLDGKIIGLIYCYSLLDLDGRLMLYMYFVVVHKKYRSMGYGSEMLRYAIDYSKSHGYAECFLNTSKNNTVACKAYEKAGMKRITDDDIIYIADHDDKYNLIKDSVM